MIYHWLKRFFFRILCIVVVLKGMYRVYKPGFLLQLASDIVYLLYVNGLGLYFRLLTEVTMRQTFLDRRACLESNSKLEYEKQQEVSYVRNIRKIVGIEQ
jgi:hypothetical protein